MGVGADHRADVAAVEHRAAGELDRELDGNAYIRPGLGDAGDRVFGTLEG